MQMLALLTERQQGEPESDPVAASGVPQTRFIHSLGPVSPVLPKV